MWPPSQSRHRTFPPDPKFPPWPLQPAPPVPAASVATDLFSLQCHINGIIERVCDLLSSVSFINTEHVNFSPVVACIGNLVFFCCLLFTAELYSIVSVYHSLLIHPPVEGYFVVVSLGLLWIKTLLLFTYRILCEWRLPCAWVNNKEGITGLCGKCVFNFVGS